MSTGSGRVIGSFTQGKPGTLLVFLGGIHGNEPAGVKALERVFQVLEDLSPDFHGKLLGLCGNCTALAEKKRFLDVDLNRLWGEENITSIRQKSPKTWNNEEKELMELLDQFEKILNSSFEQLVFVDLHTTSGTGGFFTIITRQTSNRILAEKLRAPIIFNLVDELKVTTSNYFDRKGITSLTFEAGQHDNPQSIDLHEAAIWVLLEACGCMGRAEIPNFDRKYLKVLDQAAEQLPVYLDFQYRHNISSSDEFRMNPGYKNFTRINKGEALAQDRNGVVYAPFDGIMLMPLYQKQGGDGFFITQELKQAPV